MERSTDVFIDINELLYLYSSYLASFDGDDYVKLICLLEIRTKLEENFDRLPFSVKEEYFYLLNELDKKLKEKLLPVAFKFNFERLRNMRFPLPSQKCWWYYIDRIGLKSNEDRSFLSV